MPQGRAICFFGESALDKQPNGDDPGNRARFRVDLIG